VFVTLVNTGAVKTDGLIMNGGIGRNCRVTLGVGVVGDGRVNVDCCGSGDKDEKTRSVDGKTKDDEA
jgi:hypothetical protein